MQKRHKNKLAMYSAVQSYVDDNQNLISGNEEFMLHKNSLTDLIIDIRNKQEIKNNATKGKVKDKDLTRDLVTKQALAAAGALFAFAKKTGNQPLVASVNYSRSRLDRLRDVELIIVLNSIKDKLNENSAEMIKYGISAEKLSAFLTNIETYSRAVAAKDSGGATKKGASVTLETLFKNADDLLISIDKLMENFIDSNGDFYSGYKSARVIKDLGVRRNSGIQPGPENPAPVTSGTATV